MVFHGVLKDPPFPREYFCWDSMSFFAHVLVRVRAETQPEDRKRAVTEARRFLSRCLIEEEISGPGVHCLTWTREGPAGLD